MLRGRPRVLQADTGAEHVRDVSSQLDAKHTCLLGCSWKAAWRTSGQLIESADLLIVGMAPVRDMTLVTHKRVHVARISGLQVDDWLMPSRTSIAQRAARHASRSKVMPVHRCQRSGTTG